MRIQVYLLMVNPRYYWDLVAGDIHHLKSFLVSVCSPNMISFFTKILFPSLIFFSALLTVCCIPILSDSETSSGSPFFFQHPKYFRDPLRSSLFIQQTLSDVSLFLTNVCPDWFSCSCEMSVTFVLLFGCDDSFTLPILISCTAMNSSRLERRFSVVSWAVPKLTSRNSSSKRVENIRN